VHLQQQQVALRSPEAVTYDQLQHVRKDLPTLYLDFSGDENLRAAIHLHFGDALVYDCFAGSAQNTNFLRDTGLPGPKPEFYFAPVQIRKRNKDWGHDEVNRRFNSAQSNFIDWVSSGESPRMQILESRGFEQAQKLIRNVHDGWIDPRIGHVVVAS